MKPQLYILDNTPATCAAAYADQHVLTMPEMLLEVLRAVNAEEHPLKKHILVRWATGPAEYSWLYKFVWRLLIECEHRFHISKEEQFDRLNVLASPEAPPEPKRWLQLIPEAEPGQAVKAYRKYYQNTFQGASWTHREAPDWWEVAQQQTLPLIVNKETENEY